jgi:hypothetical protein
MILFGIAVVAAGLMGAWHVTKYATPRAMRAIGAKRRSSISSWKADHPAAPPAARWAAAAARTFTGLRWGPGFLWRETKQAWREGFKAGKAKYGLLEPPAPAEAEPQAKQPKCRNDNCFCQDHPDFDGYDPDEPEPLVEEPSARPWPRLVPVSADEPATAQEEKRMTIQTATGGEIVNAEQFHAEAKAIEAEAAADMEDAAADAARAREDLARIERMVASLTGQQALSRDISAVAALRDPATARAAAADSRLAAADQRLAGAKSVAAIAARHVQLIGTAAGRFYQAA